MQNIAELSQFAESPVDVDAPYVSEEDLLQYLKQQERFIENGERLQRLMENEDFRAIFIDGFLKSYALEQVYNLTNPQLQQEKHQSVLRKNIDGIAVLKDFLDQIVANHLCAPDEIAKAKEELEDVRSEQG